MSDRDPLEDVSGAICDGRPVDWGAARSGTDLETTSVLERLREIESIATAHRAARATAASGPARVDGESRPTGFGSLELRGTLGRGSFGTVYRAFDPALERDVAVKLLRTGTHDDERAGRVVEEARLLARVRHPNVVTVYGAAVHDGVAGISMELVEGHTLAELLRERGTLAPHEALAIGIEACRALAAVHASGLLHRDVKAQNVMRAQGGRIVLMDFGAGRELVDDDEKHVSGTPLYLSPELFAGQVASVRSDIYGVGVLLFHLVTGRHPVEAATLRELRAAHGRGEALLLRDLRPDLPDAFVAVVERALERDPQRRYASAGELEHAMITALVASGARRLARPRRGARLASGTALVVIAAIAIWTTLSVRRQTTSRTTDVARSGPVPLAAPASPPAGGDATTAAPVYDVEATFERVRGNAEEPLRGGDRVRPGDAIALVFGASTPLYTYVIDEDDRGDCYLLFPLPGYLRQNPLPAAHRLRLPGKSADGDEKFWNVTSAGGREHFLILASPTPLRDLEAALQRLPRPREGEPVAVSRLSPELLRQLRGVGGLVSHPTQPHDGAGEATLPSLEMTAALEGLRERAQGVFIRRVDLLNPE